MNAVTNYIRVGISMDEYHGQKQFLGHSALWDWNQLTPGAWHDRHILGNKDDDKKHFIVGRALDTLMFEGEETFARSFIATPATYVSEGKPTKANPFPVAEEKPWNGNATACKEWMDEQRAEGREILSAEDMEIIRHQERALWANHMVRSLLESPTVNFQATIRWQDPEDGQLYQARPDALDIENGMRWWDLKTTRNLFGFNKDAFALGYHVQAALIERGLLANGVKAESGSLAIVEKRRFPRAVLRTFTGGDVGPIYAEYGWSLATKIRGEIEACRVSGVWQAIQTAPEIIAAPEWIQRNIIAGDLSAPEVNELYQELETRI